MKKLTMFTALLAIVLFTATMASAADVMLDSKIDQVVQATDKNGSEYVRIIITENKSLNGVEYTTGTPVMAFGQFAEYAKTLKPGDQLKAIASGKEYKGRMSYSILKFIK